MSVAPPRGRGGAAPVHDWLRRPWAVALAVVLLAAGAAWLAGSGDPRLVLAGLAALAVGLIVLARPAIGALCVLVLVALLPRETLFQLGLPLAGGQLKVTDALVLLTLGAWFAGRLLRRGHQPLPAPLLRWLLLGFGALALLGVVTAVSLGTPSQMALLELRPLLSYLLVFPLVADVRSRRELLWGLGIFLVACFAAAGMTLWQYVQGEGGEATYAAGAIRVTGTVFLYPLAGTLWAVALIPFLASAAARRSAVVLAIVGMSALFFTFQRGAWLAGFVGLIAVVALLPRSGRRKLAPTVALLVAGALGVILVANAQAARGVESPLAGGQERLLSVFAPGDDVSARHRVAEWERAGQLIVERPLTGIGLGSSITFESPMYSEAEQRMGMSYTTFYIHNSYVWFALKTGLPGAVLFLAFLTASLHHARRTYRRAQHPADRALLLGGFASLLAVAVLSLFGPHLNVDNATPFVAASIALIELVRQRVAVAHEQPREVAA